MENQLLQFSYSIVENLNNLLMGPLSKVESQEFLEAFEKRYQTQILTNAKEHLKDLYDLQNPLTELICIAKEQQRQNKLVIKLITLATSMTEFKDSELVNDTFHYPSRKSFIYAILFDELFSSLAIHKNIIDRLGQQWTKWEKEGTMVSDIQIWTNFSKEEKSIIHEIWSLVAQKTGKESHFDSIFDTSCKAWMVKLETNDKVITCLNTYCEKANDKKKYDDIVRQWHGRFETESIYSIDIPEDLSNILLFAERLNPYAHASAWQAFYTKQTRLSNKNELLRRQNPKDAIERQFSEELDDDVWLQEQALAASTIKIS